MNERPNLSKNINSDQFRDFYYLKQELVSFCRAEKLSTTGGKQELTERIAHYLETGEKKRAIPANKTTIDIGDITKDSIIENNFRCSEKHRAFFKETIGKSFSFNVIFQKWLKLNSGKTYQEAIEVYYQIVEEKKQGLTKIDKQFEYNTYIRDFFADNESKTLEDAIKCWKYKKSIQGHNRYEKKDLKALTQ